MVAPEEGQYEPSSLYCPLCETRREIRLVRLIHDDGSPHGISLQMSVLSLDNSPAFSALSYCWTTARPTERIKLNGLGFFVRPNLRRFLEIVFEENDDRWYFIDAICINQTDLAERSSQVQLMGEVYRSAGEAVAWLGDFQSREHELVLRLLCRSLQTNSMDFHETKMLWRLLSSSEYWTRLWIVQETLLAKRLVLRFGSVSIPASLLRPILVEIGLNPILAKVGMEEAAVFNLIHNPGKFGAPRKPQLLANILQRDQDPALNSDMTMPLPVSLARFALQRCYQKVDHVFGLLGISATHIVADYNMRALELATRVVVESKVQLWMLRGDIDEANRLDQSYRSSVLFDCYGVMSKAMDLSFRNPVWALVLKKQGGFKSVVWFSLMKDGVFGKSPKTVWSNILRSLKGGPGTWRTGYLNFVVSARSRWAQYWDSGMSAPDNADDVRTYSQWITWYNDLCRDVVASMCSPEYGRKKFGNHTWTEIVDSAQLTRKHQAILHQAADEYEWVPATLQGLLLYRLGVI